MKLGKVLGAAAAAVLALGIQHIVNQISAIAPGQFGFRVAQAEAVVQLQGMIERHLAGGIGAGKISLGVAQVFQGHRHGLSQLHPSVRPKGAVQIAANQPHIPRGFNIAGRPMAARHVIVGRKGALQLHRVLAGAGRQHHFGKLSPRHAGAQVQAAAFIAVHNLQSRQHVQYAGLV